MWEVFKGQMVQEANRRLTGIKLWDNKKSEEGYLLQLAFEMKKMEKIYKCKHEGGSTFQFWTAESCGVPASS